MRWTQAWCALICLADNRSCHTSALYWCIGITRTCAINSIIFKICTDRSRLADHRSLMFIDFTMVYPKKVSSNSFHLATAFWLPIIFEHCTDWHVWNWKIIYCMYTKLKQYASNGTFSRSVGFALRNKCKTVRLWHVNRKSGTPIITLLVINKNTIHFFQKNALYIFPNNICIIHGQ